MRSDELVVHEAEIDPRQGLTGAVTVRPYSAELAADEVETPKRERKIFRPKPPNERRTVERGLLSSTTGEDTVRSLLQDAARRQDVESLKRPGRPGAGPVQLERFQGMELRKFGVQGASGSKAGGVGASTSAAGIPRKLKDKGSLDLLDLPFAERRRRDGYMRPSYAPVSLPYFNVHDEDEEVQEGDRPKQGARPALTHIDEKNSNAAKELFLGEGGELREDRLFLMQLPSVLPELLDETEEVHHQDDAGAAGVGSTINRLPDGLLGKLRIHKSGKVTMEIAGLPFCVDEGCRTFFHQDLACVCPLAQEVIHLGSVEARAVVTPDVEKMLSEPPPGASSSGQGEAAPKASG